MYVAQPTWLENGPGRSTIAGNGGTGLPSTLANYGAEVLRVRVPAALIRRQYIKRVQGLGSVPQLSAEHCASYWSLLNPVAWMGGCIVPDAANVYEKIEYGHIPRPGELPAPPVPGVVPLGQSPAITAADMDAWKQAQAAAIQAAEDSGSYNPAGNLPMNAIDFEKFWNDYGTWVLLGGAGLAGLLLWKAAVRG